MMTLDEMLAIKKSAGLRAAQISEYSGVPIGTLNKILSGETKNPRRDTIEAIERVLLAYKPYTKTGEGSARVVREPSAVYGAEAQELQEMLHGRRQGEYTIEDYMALPDEYRVELINGIFYDMASPTIRHQRILAAFFRIIDGYIQKKGGPCEVIFAPMDVTFIGDDRTVVQPDLMIICDQDKIKERVHGAPDFVLEIASPSTSKKDYIIKAAKYEEHGVREYWILDPQKKMVMAYDLEKDTPVRVNRLEGRLGLLIYGEDLMIDLDEIAEIIAKSE